MYCAVDKHDIPTCMLYSPRWSFMYCASEVLKVLLWSLSLPRIRRRGPLRNSLCRIVNHGWYERGQWCFFFTTVAVLYCKRFFFTGIDLFAWVPTEPSQSMCYMMQYSTVFVCFGDLGDHPTVLRHLCCLHAYLQGQWEQYPISESIYLLYWLL